MSAALGDLKAVADLLRQQRLLHALSVNAFRAPSAANLIFRILNDTVALVPFDRAALWSLGSRRPVLHGVSGQSRVEAEAPLVTQWQELLAGLQDPGASRILNSAAFADHAETWKAVTARLPQMTILWLPLSSETGLTTGVWMERWGGNSWSDEERALLEALAQAYGAAWVRMTARSAWLRWFFGGRRWAAALAVLVFSLLLLRLPLRAVAPCEVVAKDPWVVSAPVAGVVEDIRVEPGKSVKPGDLLFVYDRRLAQEEAKLAAKQVQVTAAELQRVEMQALHDPKARAEMEILRLKLEQERLRQAIAEKELAKMEVRSPVAGVVMLEEAQEWRGRAVRFGETVMVVMNPDATRIRIWIAEEDNLHFAAHHPIHVVLNVLPGNPLQAALRRPVSSHVTQSPQSIPSFLAEAEWDGPTPDVKLGLKGTAILYGEGRVCLGYWLFRKPWAALRRTLGF